MEIFPTSVRARGLNFAASGGSVGSILVAQIWPVGIHSIGSNIYFFFLAVNLICIPVWQFFFFNIFSPCLEQFLTSPLLQIIYAFYPETKGRALEDMDDLFGKITPLDRPVVDHADMGDEDDEDHLAPPKGRRGVTEPDRAV